MGMGSTDLSHSPTTELPHRERAPFAVNRVLWTDADYERKHEEMKDLPCLRGVETYVSLRDTLNDLRAAHADDPAFAWEETLDTFKPEQVAMRYNGEDWSHQFHKQTKYGAPGGDEDESSVTWIAKHLVRRISDLTRTCKRRLEAETDEAEREALKKGLVQDVENTASLFYYNDRKKSGNVSVMELQGPRGPIYLSSDGNHRLAAARLIELRKVRGKVTRIQDPVAAQAFWHETLAKLPPAAAEEVRTFYDQLYPPTAEQRAAEAATQEATAGRMGDLNAKLVEIREAQRRAAKAATEKREQERVAAEQRYILVDRAYEPLAHASGFKEALHQAALDYLWNAPDDYVRTRYRREVTAEGRMPAIDGSEDAHVLSISLDAWPRDTEKEIKYAAIRAYAQGHPEAASLLEERAPSVEPKAEFLPARENEKEATSLAPMGVGDWQANRDSGGTPLRADEHGV